MSHVIARLPEPRLRALEDAYGAAVAAKRRQVLLGGLILAALVGLSAWAGEVDLAKFFANLWRFPSYIGDIVPTLRLAHLGEDLAEWYWGLGYWLRLMGETLLIAYLGTMLGGLCAISLCFLAAANLSRSARVRWLVRRVLEFCRTVPEIVFALIFVAAFGLGPVPGVLAIAIHTTGALGKLFSEVVENIDMKPVEGVSATGATWLETVRFAVLPQVLSNFASYGLLRFEINVRGAAVMGFVGAGGIGQDLIESIRKFYYSDVSAILLIIIATVMVIDLATERLRHALIGMERRS
ncbi:phosphonate ABC transporter, permease protein PhnE [Chelatococcus daeguensis]|uniref:Phosphonate ABC transporter, permease protein PhnE n=1 Tax=Chelatococcus daeguensis TaxID=444444 RepID=A0AAC9JRA3_9HYPH|nr:phosphonate ABC transporter, permease protein PhnE [Chelatococcus daeguensis]APF37771.1 phosphonate ABC transporter, permease protein PhnE [Chelatococcus daeguensis]